MIDYEAAARKFEKALDDMEALPSRAMTNVTTPARQRVIDLYNAALRGGVTCTHRYAPLVGGCRCVECGHQIAWDARLVPAPPDPRTAQSTPYNAESRSGNPYYERARVGACPPEVVRDQRGGGIATPHDPAACPMCGGTRDKPEFPCAFPDDDQPDPFHREPARCGTCGHGHDAHVPPGVGLREGCEYRTDGLACDCDRCTCGACRAPQPACSTCGWDCHAAAVKATLSRPVHRCTCPACTQPARACPACGDSKTVMVREGAGGPIVATAPCPACLQPAHEEGAARECPTCFSRVPAQRYPIHCTDQFHTEPTAHERVVVNVQPNSSLGADQPSGRGGEDGKRTLGQSEAAPSSGPSSVGRASALGAEGRSFESSGPDHPAPASRGEGRLSDEYIANMIGVYNENPQVKAALLELAGLRENTRKTLLDAVGEFIDAADRDGIDCTRLRDAVTRYYVAATESFKASHPPAAVEVSETELRAAIESELAGLTYDKDILRHLAIVAARTAIKILRGGE